MTDARSESPAETLARLLTAMVTKDRRRDRGAERRGWTTERVTWFELRRQQASVVRRMVERDAALRARPA